MKIKFTLLPLLLLFSVFSFSQILYFHGKLQGSQEVPPNTSAGGGTVIVKYDMVTNQLQLWGDYQHLSADASASHIHQAAPGVSGGIILDLVNTGDSTGTLSGSGTLTDDQEAALLAGNMYANVHTANNPAGEVRAQLIESTDGQTALFAGSLQGAQEVPPNNSAGTGSVLALLDKITGEVNVTGSFSGLSSMVNASHLHRGAEGVSGPVIVPLSYSGDTAGTVTGTDTLSSSDVTSMFNGRVYVNIHSTLFPDGEIRAQLLNKQQILFFKGMLNGSEEVPANTSAGRGVVILQYDTATNRFNLYGDFQNLSSPVTAAHIHSGAPGVSGPVEIALGTAGDSSGQLSGEGSFSFSQSRDLMKGNLYVNVHSMMYPDGEIRTQLTMATPGQSDLLNGNFSGAQEVPPTTSGATGTVKALLDKATDSVFVTGSYHSLTGPATAGHIHRAPVGVSGPVILPLSAMGSDTGSVSGAGVLSEADMMEMVKGNTYVNVHTAMFPAGEIRAQLGDIVLPVKLAYFNGYKEQNSVVLMWSSAEEVNFGHYEIEQQNPVTKEWIKKGTVMATNNVSGSAYRYTDLPTTYNSDYVYYRLKVVDKDGKYAYSQVVSLNFKQAKAVLQIRPNPVTANQLNFMVSGLPSDKKLSYLIMDFNGRILYSGNGSSLNNNTLNVSSLASGMYKLVIKVDDLVLQQTFRKE